MKIVSTLLVFSLLLVACADKEEAAPLPGKKLFTLYVDPSYNTTNSGDWLIIHDIEGNLLFSELFESGDTVSFETNETIKDNKLTITRFAFTSAYQFDNSESGYSGQGKNFKLYTYLDIPLGEEWRLTPPKEPAYHNERQLGTFRFTATDVPLRTKFILSDRFGNSNPFVIAEAGSSSYTTNAVRMSNSPNYLLVIRDPQDNIRYKFFENVIVNDQLTESFADLTKFTSAETILSVAGLPTSEYISLAVQGWEDRTMKNYGYQMGSLYEFQSGRTKLNIGYIDHFPYYRTSLDVALPFYAATYKYQKVGEKPLSIHIPFDARFTIDNRSLTSFSVTPNTLFIRRQSVWNYSAYSKEPEPKFLHSIYWVVHGGSNSLSQKIGPLPDNFKKIFPDLDIYKPSHATTTFYLQGDSYYDFVAQFFKGHVAPTEFEIYSVAVN